MSTSLTKQMFDKKGVIKTGSEMAEKLRKGKNVQQAGSMEGPYIYASKVNIMQFVYGQDETPVPDGTLFAFDIMTAGTGFAYWFKKSITTRVKSIWDDEPVLLDSLPEPQEYTPEEIEKMGKHFYGQPDWEPYYRWNLKAVHGPNLNIEAIYHGTQLYMRRLSEVLIEAAADQIETSPNIVPVGRLYNEPYDHPAGHGMTNSHKVERFGWGSPDGLSIDWIKELPAVVGSTKRRSRSRRVA